VGFPPSSSCWRGLLAARPESGDVLTPSWCFG
jgi:hypothetical protein